MAERGGIGESHFSKAKKRAAEDEPSISTEFKRLRINHAPLQYAHATEQLQRPIFSEFMSVDETKDRVVIHDLDAEIAEIEAEEPTRFFLPDIDRKVSAIPQRLLQNHEERSNTALVLYQEPTSISVPREVDAVRMAVTAARARMREKQAQETQQSGTDSEHVAEHYNHYTHVAEENFHDPDAMDIS